MKDNEDIELWKLAKFPHYCKKYAPLSQIYFFQIIGKAWSVQE